MTFQKIKETIVVEQKRMTVKELVKLTISLALAFIGLCIALGLACYAVLGYQFAFLVIVFTVVIYNWVFDLYIEDEKAATRINKLAKFWWLAYILVVAVFFILKFFRFI